MIGEVKIVQEQDDGGMRAKEGDERLEDLDLVDGWLRRIERELGQDLLESR